MNTIKKNLNNLLNKARSERDIHPFLKRNDVLIINSFSRAWNYTHCFSEFRLSDEFVTDFLIINANSCSWHAIFIELESPKARLYLKDGTPSKVLRIAQRQISDWKNWIRINEGVFRRKLSKILSELDIPAYCHPDKHIKAETEIIDPETWIHYYYHIVIGRRYMLSKQEQEVRARESNRWGGPEIATYDRFIDQAKNLQ